MSHALVGHRREDDVLETGLRHIPLDAGHRAVHPREYRAVGVVVEGVHAGGAEAVLLRVGVPALPDRRRALVDGVEPRGVLVLEEKRVGHVRRAHVVREGVHQDGRAEEAPSPRPPRDRA